MELPYIDVMVPIVRFSQQQIDKLKEKTGIIDAFGIDGAPDGSFSGVRITFSDERIMQRYIDAGVTAIEIHRVG